MYGYSKFRSFMTPKIGIKILIERKFDENKTNGNFLKNFKSFENKKKMRRNSRQRGNES